MTRKIVVMMFVALVFCAGYVAGQQKAATTKTLIHSAAWTASKDFNTKDFEAFRAVVGGLIGKVPGLKTAWVGKLQKPITVDGVTRDYGIVLEFADEATWNTYVAKRPQEFEDAFAKIRIPGSTNFNTMGW